YRFYCWPRLLDDDRYFACAHRHDCICMAHRRYCNAACSMVGHGSFTHTDYITATHLTLSCFRYLDDGRKHRTLRCANYFFIIWRFYHCDWVDEVESAQALGVKNLVPHWNEPAVNHSGFYGSNSPPFRVDQQYRKRYHDDAHCTFLSLRHH